MNKIPLVMKVWAGVEPHDMNYITRSIPSLLSSRLPGGLEVIIYDDCSPSPDLQIFLRKIASRDSRVRVIRGEVNKGPNLGQQDIYEQIVDEYPDAPYFVNVDDDVVYHRDWMTHLLVAQRDCQHIGLSGVFTALNMPYRGAHATLTMQGRQYLLKWKQPALNWLIPREVYEAVGPFRDEGIAYDTVYSHWMRLKHIPVVCLRPSYVQNIGLLGAYASDDTTTSCDFVGEGEGSSPYAHLGHDARYILRRLPGKVRGLFDELAHQVAPVRWGAEFVHEGVTRTGESVAMFSFDDAARLGWDRHAAANRVLEVQLADWGGASGIRALHRNRQGMPVWVECRWTFSPNLREVAMLDLGHRAPSPEVVFRALVQQLIPLHDKRIVHNKIRQDNVYSDGSEQGVRLTWLGTEPCPGVCLSGPEGRQNAIDLLSGALNRWALPAIREGYAARYLESLAPEVTRGEPATLQSDMFSVAAVAMLCTMAPIRNLDQLASVRARWAQDVSTELAIIQDSRARAVMEQCLSESPEKRPASASVAARLLGP